MRNDDQVKSRWDSLVLRFDSDRHLADVVASLEPVLSSLEESEQGHRLKIPYVTATPVDNGN